MVGLGILNVLPECKCKSYSTYGIRRTFQPYWKCSHNCPYCIDEDTLILMDNGTTKSIKDINIGEEIVGIKEGSYYLEYTSAKVINKWKTIEPAYKIIMENGVEIICSANHRWLTERGTEKGWKYTIGNNSGNNECLHLTKNNFLRGIGNLYFVPPETDMYKYGYIAGQIRGDGSMGIYNDTRKERYREKHYQFKLLQTDREGILRTKEYLEEFDILTNDFMVKQENSKWSNLYGIRTHSKDNYLKIQEIISYIEDPEFMRGFLGGIYDSEGSHDTKYTIRIANTNDEIISFIEKSLDYYGFRYIREYTGAGLMNIRIKGDIQEKCRFFQLIDNANKRKDMIDGQTVKKRIKRKNIIPLNEDRIMYDITTTTGNFIANGFISHNCYARLGYRWKYWAEKSDSIIAVNLRQVSKDFFQLKPYQHIEASSSCDPFDLTYETKYRITKQALQNIFNKRKDVQFTWVTKSHIIGEYADLLPKLSVPQITIESMRTDISSPKASNYEQRFKALSLLSNAGFSVGVRIDPIIPGWTTMEEIDSIINFVSKTGCKHITTSVLKMAEEQIEALEKYFRIVIRDKIIYNVSNKLYYFREEIRKDIEEHIMNRCNELGMTFATCMERIFADTGCCDPFHLLNDKIPKEYRILPWCYQFKGV